MGTHIILRVLITVYIVTIMIIQWILSWLLQVLLKIFTYPFVSLEQQQDWCGHIFRYSNFLAMDVLNPFWRNHILKPFPEVKNKKVLVMMNHLSGADPFIAVRIIRPRDCTWIAKHGLFNVPFGGWCMGNAGDLKVCFKNKRAGFETIKGTVGVMMEEARGKLRRGRPLAVFPEGIRNTNPAGGLQPFRLGFFALAVEEAAVVVPLAISGTERCWPPHSPLLGAGDVFLSCGAPIEAGEFNTAEELRDCVWEAITKLLEAHPDRVQLREREEEERRKSKEEEAEGKKEK